MSDDTLKFHRPLQDYISYFEKLSRRSVPLLEKVAAPNIYFKDPFNEIHGIEGMQKIFDHMFETLENPKFKVTDSAWGRDGYTAYLRWTFRYALKGKPQSFDGMSEVVFNEAGKIVSHIDHWDAGAGIYEKIPLLGTAIRFVKSKLTV